MEKKRYPKGTILTTDGEADYGEMMRAKLARRDEFPVRSSAGRIARQLRHSCQTSLRQWVVTFHPVRCTHLLFGGLWEIDADDWYVSRLSWWAEVRRLMGAMP